MSFIDLTSTRTGVGFKKQTNCTNNGKAESCFKFANQKKTIGGGGVIIVVLLFFKSDPLCCYIIFAF